MKPQIKKISIIILIIAMAGGILQQTSNLDNIQIGLTLFFGRIVFISTKQKKLIKYPGTSIGLLVIIFLLGLAYFPLFQNIPNPEDFIATQSRHIIVNSNEDTSLILIKQQGFTKQQEISKTKKEIIIKEGMTSTINFINKNKESGANMNIQFPDQTTIVIYPNTLFSLEITGNKQIINKISGKMEYIMGQTNSIIINNAELKNISDFSAKGLWQTYNNKQRNYIINKAGGVIMENENIRYISHNILTLAAKIRPNKYLSYLENEKKYKEILNRQDTKASTYQNNTKNTTSDMLKQAQQAGSKTKFLQFLSK